MSLLAACSADKAAKPKTQSFETPTHALDRLAPTTTEALPAEQPDAAGYEITFQRFSKETAPQTLTRTIVRPFGERTTEGGTRSIGFLNDSAGSARRVTLVRPGPNDPRPRQALPDPSFTPGPVRRVAGQLCQSYTKQEHEYCVDSRGVQLFSATPAFADIATKINYIDAAPEPAAYAQLLANGFSDPNLGSIRPIAPDSSPPGATDYALPAPPDGFAFVGRYAYVPLSAELLSQTSKEVIAGIVDVYVRGADAIVVDRGGRLDKLAVAEKQLGAWTDVSDVDDAASGFSGAKVGVAGDGPFGYRELRAFPQTGRYVVVAGTVPSAELTRLAKALRPSPGTDLKYLDSLG